MIDGRPMSRMLVAIRKPPLAGALIGTLVLAVLVAGPSRRLALAGAAAAPADPAFAPAIDMPERVPLTDARVRFAQVEASDLIVRLDQLESQVRQLTGQIEQLQYRNQQLEQQLRRVQEEAELRQPDVGTRGAPRMAPGRAAGSQPAVGPAPTVPPASMSPPAVTETGSIAPTDAASRRGDAFDPNQSPNVAGAPRTLGTLSQTPAGTMGPAPGAAPSYAGAPVGQPVDLAAAPSAGFGRSTLPGSPTPSLPPRNAGEGAPSQIALAPNATPKDEFDLAYGYVLHKDYALAEQAFRDFLSRFPGDRLVPDAQYWLGETLFQLQRYRDAAESFLALSTKYETAGRAPDALLRLGQSLAALNEKQAACATFGEVVRKYPHASVTVRQSVDRELKRVHC